MAESPSHRFGQLIGEILESIVRPQLEEFCLNSNLYLDHQQKNRPARSGKKVSWSDPYGNIHDLDFVIERGGSDQQIGVPVAFIECAWRRYTKHSRNKAQEIQGAILPLWERFKNNNPFLGVVLAGVFTDGALEQLRSQGFHVLYFPYQTMVEAFKSESINILFDESTPDSEFSPIVRQVEQASLDIIERIRLHLINSNRKEIDIFFEGLKRRMGRWVIHVSIIPLYGRINNFVTIEDALSFLDSHSIYEGSGDFRKYEIHIEFSNGDKVDASIEAKDRVKEFLRFVSEQ